MLLSDLYVAVRAGSWVLKVAESKSEDAAKVSGTVL